MDKSLKEILLEVMRARGVKVPMLSKQTKIPKDRIYKWFQQGSTPSPEDSVILERWIKKQNYEVEKVSVVSEEDSSIKYYVDKDEVIKSQRETISVQKKMIQHLEKIIDELRSDNGSSTNSKAGSFG